MRPFLPLVVPKGCGLSAKMPTAKTPTENSMPGTLRKISIIFRFLTYPKFRQFHAQHSPPLDHQFPSTK